MDYSVFKALQALLFFGLAIGVAVWQLVDVRRSLRKTRRAKSDEPEPDDPANRPR
jgi:hypothetical protein